MAQVGLRVPTPHAEAVLSVHLQVRSLVQGGCIALAQRPTYCMGIPAMPHCVTAKLKRNTLLCFALYVSCVHACICVCGGVVKKCLTTEQKVPGSSPTMHMCVRV